MKYTILGLSFLALVLFSGCRDRLLEPDFIPPAVPQGLLTSAGDQEVFLSWYPNTEPDLAGYNVYYSSSYSGPFHLIGTISGTHFTDRAVRNGSTYFYALTAFDIDGNESNLSQEEGRVTPRPEGYDIVLDNFRTVPDAAGYEFSSLTVGPYDDKSTDLFFESTDGRMYLDVWDDTEIQDMGYTATLYDISVAPTIGWSPTHDVTAIPGHTYIILTWDNHYAKVRVTSVSETAVRFDWAYQLQSNNPQLKTGTTQVRNPLNINAGIKSR